MTEQEPNAEYQRIYENAKKLREEFDELNKQHELDKNDTIWPSSSPIEKLMEDRFEALQKYANKYPSLDTLLDNLPTWYMEREKHRRLSKQQEALVKKMDDSNAIQQAKHDVGYVSQDERVANFIANSSSDCTKHYETTWNKFKNGFKKALNIGGRYYE